MTINYPLQIYFLELHMDILMQQLLHTSKKYAVGQSFFVPKIISLKAGSWLQPLADLGGRTQCTPPPKGPNSFVLTYKIFEM